MTDVQHLERTPESEPSILYNPSRPSGGKNRPKNDIIIRHEMTKKLRLQTEFPKRKRYFQLIIGQA